MMGGMPLDRDPHADVDRLNRAAMRASRTVAHYESAHELDPAELVLFDRVRAMAEGQPILDLGVGAGRTVPALTALSADYHAIDYTPEMVDACRQRFPHVDVQHGDACDLGRFADGSFALVVFSCAGIDMVGRRDRARILDEVRRVLRPGGAFVFSTHNRWHRRVPRLFDLIPAIVWRANPLHLGRSVLRSLVVGARQLRNHRRHRRHEVHGPDFALLNSHYHEYTTMMHYTSREAQERALRDHGFSGEIVCLTHEATPATAGPSPTLMFHFCAFT